MPPLPSGRKISNPDKSKQNDVDASVPPMSAGEYTERAQAISDTALRVSETTDGPQHPESRSIRLSLAETLLSAELTAEDRKLVEAAIGEPLAGLPDTHPFVAQRNRVMGLLAMRDGDSTRARASLQAALDIHESRYGTRHWRSVRARQELQRATS